VRVVDDGMPEEEEPPASVPESTTLAQVDDAPVEASLEQRAVWLYSRTGSLARVARELSIPIYELTKLSRTQFWLSELAAIQREEAAIQNVQMSRILNSTLHQIEDRIENGDVVFVNGSLRRKAVDASVLAKIASVIFDKRQLLRGQPTTIDGADAKIRELADRLRALGAKEVYEAPALEQPIEDRRSASASPEELTLEDPDGPEAE
jgi:hypothetical protein